MDRLRVAVFAADPLTHMGICRHLQSTALLTVVANQQFTGAGVALVVTETVDDDILILLRQLTDQSTAKIVLVSDLLPEPDVRIVARTRVVSHLRRSTTGVQEIAAAAQAAPDRPVLTAGELSALFVPAEGATANSHATVPSQLNAREIDVLRLIADGLDTAEVAHRLSFSERTVKNIINHMTSRLGYRNRAHAVAHALRDRVI